MGLLRGLGDVLMGRAGVPASAGTPAPAVAPTAVPWLDGRSAIALSSVWRCVTLIADLASDMPWGEWKGDTELEASRLVRRPLASMTRREWTWRMVATEALYNTAYALHTGGTDSEGVPWSLLPIPPAAIAPADYPDPWGLIPPREYLVGDMRIQASQLTIIRRAPWPGLPDYMAGILDIARRQFSAYLAADTAMSRYWQAGGPTQTVITTDQVLENDEADAIAQRWLARRSLGADYPAVLGKGAKADPWGADPTTESAVEARREIHADVGRYFGVPTRILNAPAGDSETYSNVEADAVDLERYTLRGYIGPVEDAISELLPGDYQAGRRMRLDSSRLTQGDLASRALAYPALVTAGIFTAPEARVRGFGLPPKPTAAMAGEPPPIEAPATPAGVTATIQ